LKVKNISKTERIKLKMAQAVYPPKYQALVEQFELKADTAENLFHVLLTCDIALLCDDSTSMQTKIVEPGQDPFANAAIQKTRWSELKVLAAAIINVVTAINPNGLDIYFLNRPYLLNQVDTTGLQQVFAAPPSGKTPLRAALTQIYNNKIKKLDANKSLLIVTITDGEPSDCSANQLYNLIAGMTASGKCHVSFADCTNDETATEYLDSWNRRLKNFDNTDDYREECIKVKRINGRNFKFDYNDYVIKILLATFVRWYFNLDQQNTGNINNSDCCTIL
jgi:uncharacterized protein YegL